MARGINKLTALAVQKNQKPGYHGDGGGLWLKVTKTGSKSWIFRYTRDGKTKDMGLGPTITVSLAEARQKALECRKLLIDCRDPLDERKNQRLQAKLDSSRDRTFSECAISYIDAHKSGWKSEKHAKQWGATLETYAFPVAGQLPVSVIDTGVILRVLEPIWHIKTETASRVRGRIESILDWAKVCGYRQGDNPARWKGHLDKLLPLRNKVQKVRHHAALPYAELGAFMHELKKCNGLAARALEFGILTAARSSEIRNATWDEIDFQNKLWIIPALRMKAGKEHRVPLCNEAVELLNAVPRIIGSKLIFPSQSNRSLSDMTLTAVLRRMERNDLTQHGFRSTFRDWAGETTPYPREVIEHALAHQLKDKAEAAYQRGDLLAKRFALMTDWGRYCYTESTGVQGDVQLNV